jgi:hypothetical protein
LGKKIRKLPVAKKPNGFHLLQGFIVIVGFSPPAKMEIRMQPGLDRIGEKLEEGNKKMRFQRKIPIRSLDEVFFAHPHTFLRHGFLISQSPDMFDNGIGKYDIKFRIFDKRHVCRITHYGAYEGQGWL